LAVIELRIPGRPPLSLSYLILDLNGTLTLDGHVIPGVKERLAELSRRLDVVVVTCDTRGNAGIVAGELGVPFHRTDPTAGSDAEQKLRYCQGLGLERCVAVGNGGSDALILKECALGIAVMGAEGASLAAVCNADVLVGSILDALDLLLFDTRLIATLRGSV
jgi:soluble P-type ATPase